MSNNMKDPLEPLSPKSIIASLLLSLAIMMLFSQFVTKGYKLRQPSEISLKPLTEQVYAEAIPDQIVPQKPPEPVKQPEPTKVAETPPPAPKPVPELPKPVAKPKPAPVAGSAKAFIYMKESGNNPSAQNKNGACGLGQSLPCSKMASVCPNWKTDYECQDRWFTNYMKGRYGSWEKARAFWQSKASASASGRHGWW